MNIISGIAVHIIFLVSIFEIYFKSPIVDGIDSEKNNIKPPAKRLILFVADGLRADMFFELENGTSKSPFLRHIIDTKSVWGLSHARIPTESRPGNVALIAGFYEDPSAVFKGWKENPVEFDSLFNRSTATYSWGSPDILPMFQKGAVEGRIYTDSYSSDLQDFSGRNSSATQLNDWVFDKFEKFLREASVDSEKRQQLNRNGVVFFLHLLGTDVAGHANKPHSREYKDTIVNVDAGIESVVKQVEHFFSDKDTAYIFTSDHGMTDWGSHGAGLPSETETPIVAWGAGVSSHQNVNIRQADIVPLMAVLLGLSIPVHSLGTLPVSFLDASNETIAECLLLNSRQLVAQLKRHRESVTCHLLPLFHAPFPHLHQATQDQLTASVEDLIAQKRYQDAMEQTINLISLAMMGIKYYQTYFQNFLLAAITLSYIAWIMWITSLILPNTQLSINSYYKEKTHNSGVMNIVINTVFTLLLLLAVCLLFVQKFGVQYYVFSCLPVWLWWKVSLNYKVFLPVVTYISGNFIRTLCWLAVYLGGLELLVLTFFYRSALSILLLGFGLWPFIDKKLRFNSIVHRTFWSATCLCLAVFPLLPTIGAAEDITLVIISGCLWLMAGIFVTLTQARTNHGNDGLLSLFQLSLFPLTIWLTSSTADSFKARLGLPLLNQATSWVLLIVSLIIPLLSSRTVLTRLGSVSLGLSVPFLLLSVGHEAFFLLALTVNLFCWLTLEKSCLEANTVITSATYKNPGVKQKESSQTLNGDDFRRAFFFLCYIVLSFFGTGNIASVNSFNIDWVRCFLTVFSPFTMTALILLKTLIPFLLVGCAFQALSIVSKVEMKHQMYMFLVLSNVMGIQFLYAVTNEGSWLDIGTSISHYVIVQTMILFIVVLFWVASFCMSRSIPHPWSHRLNYVPRPTLESRPGFVIKDYVWSPFDKNHLE
ncbi:GPI ethanolamine phosphate transferase 1 isoform X2 [Nilaparvata lugens]|uniref:GPI ethanolamine phosphate transferase 1 isoform X2 n=1 Tax=Nilaparvata lugens TaxID=108931 RepID=UPI00193CEBA4|nr:GPI ethanolamine phosphate transferase 1 isoform X2 [Nilaparvata lugens]